MTSIPEGRDRRDDWPESGDIRTDADFTLTVMRGPEALAEADTVVVPGSEVDHEPHAGYLEPSLAAALTRIRPGTRIASICTGSFVLAAAGLLAGRRATTHWRSSARVRGRFPDVTFDLGGQPGDRASYLQNGRTATAATATRTAPAIAAPDQAIVRPVAVAMAPARRSPRRGPPATTTV